MMKPPECHFLQDAHCTAVHEVADFQTHLGKAAHSSHAFKSTRCPRWAGGFLFACLCPKACF